MLATGVVAGLGAGSNSTVGTGGDAVAAAPGRGYRGGLTAVRADATSEASIFQALRERRCYATTGHRLLMDFAISGAEMGATVETGPGERELFRRRVLSAKVHGTDVVDRIEVVRNNVEVCTYRGDSPDEAFEWTDEQDLGRIALQRSVRGSAETCYYYLRVTQVDGEVAWSSPIWFTLRRT